MGKDREGAYHPPKGNPSGPEKGAIEEIKSARETESLYQDLAEKYTDGQEEMPINIKVRHPNRNVNKGEEKKIEKKNSPRDGKSKVRNIREENPTVMPEELPGVLSKELFESLVNYTGEFCVSLYLPTHRVSNGQEDKLAFKNSLQQTAAELKAKGIDAERIERVLEPGYELIRNDVFWRYQDQGLAVFVADDFFKYVKMPDTPVPELLVNSSFMVKPLVNAMTVKEYFYLLVISKKQAKFFRANAFGMQPVELEELPNGIEDVVHLEEKVDQKLFRTESAQGGKGGAFHGHGAGKPDEKENIAMYLEEVDETLWDEVLNKENVPLLLAGVEYLLPIYRSVSGYKFIWNDVITGSHEHDDLNALFQLARGVMEPYFQERTKKALAQYGNQSATALTSTLPADIIPAAHYGRIAHLFLLRESHVWGTFNEMDNVLNVHETKQEGDECLVDKTVIKTILNGGDVHFLNREDMPAESTMAALMRY